MRAVAQRVSEAAVRVDGEVVGQIGSGLMVLLGITHDDDASAARAMAGKLANLRILPGEVSVLDADSSILVISQFTLYGDTRKGRRPSWTAAAPGPVAEPLYRAVCQELQLLGVTVAMGRFGADMKVSLVNDGPFTVLIET